MISLENYSIRQLLHVGYKVAARKSGTYLRLVRECEPTISRNVTHNLFERHIRPVFLGQYFKGNTDILCHFAYSHPC